MHEICIISLQIQSDTIEKHSTIHSDITRVHIPVSTDPFMTKSQQSKTKPRITYFQSQTQTDLNCKWPTTFFFSTDYRQTSKIFVNHKDKILFQTSDCLADFFCRAKKLTGCSVHMFVKSLLHGGSYTWKCRVHKAIFKALVRKGHKWCWKLSLCQPSFLPITPVKCIKNSKLTWKKSSLQGKFNISPRSGKVEWLISMCISGVMLELCCLKKVDERLVRN